jgi:pantoate--beta-alanine ligase
MILLRTRAELREWRKSVGSESVGFVPTMGALHEGHLSLVRRSKSECARTVASIFVNPLQFGPKEDLSRYPRPFEKDSELLSNEGVDALFAPSPTEMYPSDRSTQVVEAQVSQGLCGAARPGHFDGVCTVVLKLFNLVLPDLAYFGEKDAQQLRVIERMVRDLDLSVQVVRVPTVREKDGLALSSRNVYLSSEHRELAPRIYQALQAVRKSYQAGEVRVSVLEAQGRQILEQTADFRVQYFEVRHRDSLETLRSGQVPQRGALALVAAYLGSTRLIDNLDLS